MILKSDFKYEKMNDSGISRSRAGAVTKEKKKSESSITNSIYQATTQTASFGSELPSWVRHLLNPQRQRLHPKRHLQQVVQCMYKIQIRLRHHLLPRPLANARYLTSLPRLRKMRRLVVQLPVLWVMVEAVALGRKEMQPSTPQIKCPFFLNMSLPDKT